MSGGTPHTGGRPPARGAGGRAGGGGRPPRRGRGQARRGRGGAAPRGHRGGGGAARADWARHRGSGTHRARTVRPAPREELGARPGRKRRSSRFVQMVGGYRGSLGMTGGRADDCAGLVAPAAARGRTTLLRGADVATWVVAKTATHRAACGCRRRAGCGATPRGHGAARSTLDSPCYLTPFAHVLHIFPVCQTLGGLQAMGTCWGCDRVFVRGPVGKTVRHG